MLPSSIISYFRSSFEIFSAQTMSGGCINDCYQLETSKGNFFLKLNSAKVFPRMFECERKGLELLASTNTVKIPGVIETGVAEGTSFLLMEFVEGSAAKTDSMRLLGRNIAALHQNTTTHFGLEYDNYIGSLPQCNKPNKSWTEFFGEMRLRPQLEMARNKNLISPSLTKDFEKLFAKPGSLFSEEKPALLHGDLWSGNYLINTNGIPYLVDPAVYYGHREMDIAMSKLFGGFNHDFYSGYNEVYPLEKNWQQRIDFWCLYPLLVHVNLFGEGYVSQLRSCLMKFI